jgi:PKD domain
LSPLTESCVRTHVMVVALILLPLGSVLAIDLGTSYPLAHAQSNPVPTIQVLSRGYGNNITNLNFVTGTTFTVDVNVTNAGAIMGFDITLDYAISPMITTVLSTSHTEVSLSPGLFDGSGLSTGCTALIIRDRIVFGDPFDTVRVAAVLQSSAAGTCAPVVGTGRLFSVTFTVVGTGATSLDIEQTTMSAKLATLLVGPPPDFASVPNLHVIDAYFRNKPGIAPVAEYSFTPNAPLLGNTVSFDATQSYDPDNATGLGRGVRSYLWVFGDNSRPAQGSQVTHVFTFGPITPASGFFEVRLVIIDVDDGIPVQQATLVHVLPPTIHDVAVSIAIDRFQVNASTPIQISVIVQNRGNRDENVTLNVDFDYKGDTPIANVPQFLLPQNSVSKSFSFTLQTTNLPARAYTITAFAQLVNAIDVNPLDNIAQTSFVVLPNVGKLDVTVDTGSIYFPGDTVVIYTLSQFNGAAISPDSVQLTLFKPDGSNSSLQTTPVSVGLSRATYPISNIGPFGTYALVAKSQKSGFTQGVALATFEVKPNWLSRNGQGIMEAVGAVGMFSTIAVAWQRGYLRKKE